MRVKRYLKRTVAYFLVISMLIGLMPMNALADETTKTMTEKNVDIVQSYAAQMRNANQKSDYSKGGFSWDTENKSDSWRYFNGLMLDALLMVGGEGNIAYADAFYSGNINNDGTVKNYASGELDAVESGRGLFDMLGSANAEKYKKAIQYVYTQLEKQVAYDSCGGNLLHKQDGSGNPTGGWDEWNIGLDGLYMAEPFLMECANAIDSGKLALTKADETAVTSDEIYSAVYQRFAWVYDAMYDGNTGLYNHGYNVSKSAVNGHFWSRGIGWYAMALVDVIGMMPEGANKTNLIGQLPRLFDGMMKYQDAATGMWYNVPNKDANLSKNILETSGSSMMAYALMKAFNNGWVSDSKYGEAGLKAFNGVVKEKVTGSEGSYAVKDIYLKSGVGTTDSYYCKQGYTTNEAKGTGALIMASTLANATVQKLGTGGENGGEATAPESLIDKASGIVVAGSGASAITVQNVTENTNVSAALADKMERYVAYDIKLSNYTQGQTATVSIPILDGYDADQLACYYVAEDGTTEMISGSADGSMYKFETNHFSVYALGSPKAAAPSTSVTKAGNLAGETVYELVTDGEIENGGKYLIVNGNKDQALKNNNGNAGKQEVTVSNNKITGSVDPECVWTFTKNGNGYQIKNGDRYIRLNKSSWISTNSATATVVAQTNGAFRINSSDYYLRYSSDEFQRSNSNDQDRRNLYLFKETTTPGSSVSLTVTPGSSSMMAGAELILTPSVLVDEAAASNYHITWSSSNENVATVDANGKVTAKSDGTATITAALTDANGKSVTETVSVQIPITVSSKAVTSAVLSGNTPVTTRKGVEPDFSNIKLTVTYEDGTTEEITTANGLQITGYSIDTIGFVYAAISYRGTEYGTVKVTVEGNPYEGITEADSYPEYPQDGAVRLDKTATGVNFASTGVTKVELDAAGISVKQGVDVVLVVDVSNSMGWSDNWFEGMTADEVTAAKDNSKIPNGTAADTTDKLDIAMNAAAEFANILLADNKAGAASNNSLSFVTFAGYDADNTNAASNHIDSVQTVFSNVQEANAAKNSFGNTKFTEYSVSGTSVGYTLQIGKTDGTTVSGTNRGNTNYDYAFGQANAAVTELQNSYGGQAQYKKSGRETVVVFMTDGAPSHYNDMRANGNAKDTKYGTKTTYPGAGSYTNATWLKEIMKLNTYAQTLAENIGAFYALGFDLNHGGFSDFSWTQEELEPVLRNLAGENSVEVKLASDGAALTEFYKSLANKIKLAGTNAQVTDTLGSEYTLQMTKSLPKENQLAEAPKIEVIAYDLYSKADINGTTITEANIGERTGEQTVLETVTFNADGIAAYSDQVDNGAANILTTDTAGNVTIAGAYFTYTKDAEGTEKFVWTIGDITDKEIALSYYAYLKGSLEGTREEGIYATNEEAKLEYVDINGKHAVKTYPVPKMNWGGASTTFEYYLVNEKGEPVNRAGQVVPLANRIILYGDTIALNLNQDLTVPAQTINASDYLPEGYFLYDNNAYYTVSTASGSGLKSGVTVSEPSGDAFKKTGTVQQTGAQTTIPISHDEYYTQSRVAFGIRWDLTPTFAEKALEKDAVVIDYGKAIQVDVAANDASVENGYEVSLAGYAPYNKNANLTQIVLSPGKTEYETANGTYKIVDGKVQFQPKRMLSEVEKVFCVMKVTKTDDVDNFYYLYEELNIIPASIMYYETDFAAGVFTFTDGTESAAKWNTKTDNKKKDDEIQNDGTIGMNQIYGFDSTYTDDANYSNGTSYMVEGQEDASQKGMARFVTNTSFSFTGTGFDLISRTGEDQGAIRADIYSDAAMTTRVKSVTVLNKSESKLELYQIPVVSVNDLPYGTYYVKIGVNAAYTDTVNAALSRGGEFYFDAVRIYDPISVSGTNLAGDAAIAQAAYTADGEADYQIFEVRQMILDKETYNAAGGDTVTNTVTYIDRTPNGAVVADYATIGPNNEVYLANNQGIAFKLTSDTVPASIDIGAKSADGHEVTLSASLSSLNDLHEIGISEEIASCTAQYYDLMADAANNDCTMETILSGGGAYVIIFNDGDGVLSITDLKVAYGDTAGSAVLSSDSQAVAYAANVLNGDVQKEEPDYDIKSAAFTSEQAKLRKDATLVVTTTDDVKSLKVTDKKGREVKAEVDSESADGMTTWTVKIKMTIAGKQTYTVTGYSGNGTAGTPASASIKVKR